MTTEPTVIDVLDTKVYKSSESYFAFVCSRFPTFESFFFIFSANVEIARVRKSNESEIAVMKAALKKEQTKSASLEMSLQQKVRTFSLAKPFKCGLNVIMLVFQISKPIREPIMAPAFD